MKHFSAKKAIIILIIIGIVGSISVITIAGKKDNVTYVTEVVRTGRIIQTVSETGTVKASSEIDLSFLNTGRVAKINYHIGDKIKKDEVIAELDYNNLLISKDEFRANLDVAQENLNKVLAGATYEAIEVAKADVARAKASYDAAKEELVKIQATEKENISQADKKLFDLESNTPSNITTNEQAIIVAETNLKNTKSIYQRSIDNYKESGLVTADDKLSVAATALDTIDRILNDDDIKDLISISNLQYLTNTKNYYKQSLDLLNSSNASLLLARQNDTGLKASESIESSLMALNKVFKALQSCFSALENTITSSVFTLSELDTFKTNISTQKTAVATAISSIKTAEQNLNDAFLDYDTNVSTSENDLLIARVTYNDSVINAKNALTLAQVSGDQKITIAESRVGTALESYEYTRAQYNQTVAPPINYDVSLYRAKHRQAQALVDTIDKNIENSLIHSPIDGTITKIEYDVGEQVSAGVAVISVLVENDFEIEVLISEADIAKIKKDDNALITLDAFGDEIEFIGTTGFIEPAETIIQDVIYYKVIINFDPGEEIVKSGMTANIVITTAKKDNVLVMPSRAIVEKNGGGKYVRLLNSLNEIEEKPVTINMRGDEGLVEIITGVTEGDKVVTHVREK